MPKLRSIIIFSLALASALSQTAAAAYADKTFTVTNSGNGTLTISGPAIKGNIAEYALLSGHNCTTVAVGASCAMTVRFTPTGDGTRDPASLEFTSNGANGPSHSIALSGAGASCTAGKQIYSYTGADQVIAVPAWCTTAVIKAWGAGGFAGHTSTAGGGGYATKVASGLTPGSSLVIVVGQGGTGVRATYGGGGAGAPITGTTIGGDGGGLSGVFRGSKTQANAVAIAGGGGGGYYGAGGAGGGLSGLDSGGGAGGGTQSAGGAPGPNGTAGGPLQGGSSLNHDFYTAGGGGGYWGGGGASFSSAGGGSGYAPNGTLVPGSGCSVASAADLDYVAGTGNGGCSANTSGQNGRVVIIWK